MTAMMTVIVVIMIMLIITGLPRGCGDCSVRRNRGRQKGARVTKVMMMVVIKITFFFFSVINCEPLAAVVDLSLIGRAAVWGVN